MNIFVASVEMFFSKEYVECMYSLQQSTSMTKFNRQIYFIYFYNKQDLDYPELSVESEKELFHAIALAVKYFRRNWYDEKIGKKEGYIIFSENTLKEMSKKKYGLALMIKSIFRGTLLWYGFRQETENFSNSEKSTMEKNVQKIS